MRILNRFRNQPSVQLHHPTANDLRAIWNRYSDQWSDDTERYDCWKPALLLPAPKCVIKCAIKLSYAEWPEPIDWGIFAPFFMEFVDLALYLPEKKYDVVEKFRKRHLTQFGATSEQDPLLLFKRSSILATSATVEINNQDIIQVRDKLRRSAAWDPHGASDNEIEEVRQILLESTTEYASLIAEWRFYILSIGRDQYTNT